VTGEQVQLELTSFAGDVGVGKGAAVPQPAKTVISGRQLLAEKSNDPFVKQVAEIFGAAAFRADPPSETQQDGA